MTQEEFLSEIAVRLETARIPFMVVGSYASSLHGEPRTTQDVDLVIDPTAAQLDHFLAGLGDRFYASPEAARDALQRRSMFNVIDFDEGWKVDLIVRKERPFSVEEFQRRQPTLFLGRTVPIASAEDVLLAKLEWNKITPSERQLKDAFNIILAQGARLNRAYLRHWAVQLGVQEELEQLLLEGDTLLRGTSP